MDHTSKIAKALSKLSSKELRSQNSENLSEANITVSPADFDEFLQWACSFFGIDVIVSKKAQVVYETVKPKKGKGKLIPISDEDKELKSLKSSIEIDAEKEANMVHVVTSYFGNDLVQILVDKTKHIPRKLFALIACVLEFHPRLQRITVNRGLDQYSIYELSKILNLSAVTEVVLDDCFVKEANYDILLDKINHLQVLSLARCKIGDTCVKNIAARLHYPLPASSSLRVLNLSSNRLTNSSCKYIAEMLRSNRKVNYINMASNMITDEGGKAVLRVLLQFPLTVKEVLAFKQRYVDYLREKQYLIEVYEANLKASAMKKLQKPPKTIERPGAPVQAKNVHDYEKAAAEMANKSMGEFIDPMTDCTNIDGLRHCNGNNTLLYLNLAYNTLTYVFIQFLLKVLRYQYSPQRQSKGLINVRLEGNPMPVDCMDFSEIDGFLDLGVTIITKKPSTTKKTKPVNIRY